MYIALARVQYPGLDLCVILFQNAIKPKILVQNSLFK